MKKLNVVFLWTCAKIYKHKKFRKRASHISCILNDKDHKNKKYRLAERLLLLT